MVAAVHTIGFEAMASQCEVRLGVPDPRQAQALAQLAIAEVRRIEYKYSRYRPDSVVACINRSAGQAALPCDAETASLLAYAATLHQASDGLFDITSSVLRRAWNFGQPAVPRADVLAPLLALVGWDKVRFGGGSVYLPHPGMELDFGGFGKEYAADCAAAQLARAGVRHGYLNLGGDMRFLGPQPDGSPWSIGIQDPREPGAVVATIPVSSGALATSGDYERYFDWQGKRYCHILDPRSGMPVQHWRSVSVLAPLAVAAGSCATIAMLKQQDAPDFLNDSDLAYFAVDDQAQLLYRDRPT